MTGPTIRARIVLWFVGLSGALVAASSLALYRTVEREGRDALDETLRSRAAAFASLVEFDEGRFEFEAEGLPASTPGEPGQGYEILDARGGRRIARSQDLDADALPTLGREVPPGERSAFRTVRLATGRPVRVHAGMYAPRIEGHAPAAAPELLVVVFEEPSELEARLDGLARAIAVAAPAVLALAVACGWFLARRIVGPLAMLAHTAREIQGADPSRRLPVRGTRDEIDELAGALNEAFGRIEAAFERQTRFTADAAHELRTPIAVVRTQAEVALRSGRTGSEYREILGEILAATIRVEETLDALLVLARSDAGDLPGGSEAVDLDALAREVAGAFAAEAAGRSIALEVDGSGGALARGDPGQLRVALRNLVSNAIRYSEPGGRVSVRVHPEGDRVRIEVADQGIGIPAEHLPHVFDRFRRVDDARSRRRGGSGLGLSIVQAIVRGHGGTVEAASHPGSGSTFVVRLPPAGAGPARAGRSV